MGYFNIEGAGIRCPPSLFGTNLTIGYVKAAPSQSGVSHA